MADLRKTKAQLLAELTALRQRVAQLEAPPPAETGPAQDPAPDTRWQVIAELMTDYVYGGTASPDGTAHTDWVSGAFQRITGYTLAEVQALPGEFGSLVLAEDLAAFLPQQARLFAGEAITIEYRIHTRSGELRWLRDHMQPDRPVTNPPGLRLVGAVQDITESKLAEAALRVSEEKYRLLVETASEGIWVMDRAHRTTYVNHAMAAMLGYTPADMLGRPVEDFFFPEDLPTHAQHMQRRHAGQDETYERRFQCRDGSSLWTLVSARVLTTPAGDFNGSFALFTDITARKQAETRLRTSEELFRTVVEHAHDGINLFDLKTHQYTFMSPSQIALTGFTADELNNITDEEAVARVHPADRDISAAHQRALAAGEPATPSVEYRWQVKNGEYRWFRDSRTVIRDESGQPTALVGVSTDITERKQAEAALQQSNARLEEAQRLAQAGSWEWDLPTNHVWWSAETYQIFGVAPADYSPSFESNSKFIHPDDLDAYARAFDQSLTSGEPLELDLRLMAGDGRLKHCHAQGQLMRNDSGHPVRFVGTIMDITARKQAEAAAQANYERFNALFNNAPLNGIIYRLIRDDHGDIVDWEISDVNPLGAASVGGRAAELIGQRTSALFGNEVMAPYVERSRHVAATGEAQVFETHFAGNARDYLSSVFMVGRNHYANISIDITDMKRAEQARRESEEQYQLLFETMVQGVVFQDAAGRITQANPAAERILGLTLDQLQGRTSTDPRWHAIHEGGRDFPGETHPAMLALQTGQPVRDVVMGVFNPVTESYHWLNINAVPRFLPNAPQPFEVYTTFEDITARKQAEAELRASQEKYRGLLESLDSVVALIDAEGRFQYMNEVGARALGDTADRIVGQTMADLFPEPVASLQLGQIRQAILTDQSSVYQTESIVQGQPRWYRSSMQPIHDETGRAVYVLLNTTDITSLVRAQHDLEDLNRLLEERVAQRTQELAAANERLTELDKLKSKFVSDVSHELRTPVTSLSLYIDLLQHGKPEKRELYVIKLQEQMARLHKLIDDILDLSRLERDRDEGGRSPVDVNSIAEHVSTMERGAAEAAGLTLTCEVTDSLPPVVARPDQLTRAITNLVSNAIKYTRQGAVRVITRAVDNHVCVEVRDTGQGIPADELPHLFGRFYRGRAVAQSSIPGTGLGLSIVKEIIESHGGTVEVESTVGVGSVFTICLPGA